MPGCRPDHDRRQRGRQHPRRSRRFSTPRTGSRGQGGPLRRRAGERAMTRPASNFTAPEWPSAQAAGCPPTRRFTDLAVQARHRRLGSVAGFGSPAESGTIEPASPHHSTGRPIAGSLRETPAPRLAWRSICRRSTAPRRPLAGPVVLMTQRAAGRRVSRAGVRVGYFGGGNACSIDWSSRAGIAESPYLASIFAFSSAPVFDCVRNALKSAI